MVNVSHWKNEEQSLWKAKAEVASCFVALPLTLVSILFSFLEKIVTIAKVTAIITVKP